MKRIYLVGLMVSGLAGVISAQPGPIPPGTNTNCNANPGTDTLAYAPDTAGFSFLFDGTSTKGWWESCQSTHSNADKTQGGIWIVDPTTKSLYSTQKAGGAGSLFMTNQKFGNYELILDVWPDFNNDAGVFNRSTPTGAAYQTTIDYIKNSSVGGSFGEGIKERGTTGSSWNTDPYKFGANENSIEVQADNSWTVITKNNNPGNFGCAATGCIYTDWPKVWDPNGWNQMRIKVFSGLTATTNTHMQVWMRDLRAPNKPWVPFLDQIKNVTLPPNHIGLQVHGGSGSWGGGGNWYRNIKWQPLDDNGNRIFSVGTRTQKIAEPVFRIQATSTMLSGVSETSYEVTIRDLAGKVVEKFSGQPGEFQHSFTSNASGVLAVEFKTARGVHHQRVSRLF
ncbi:MAG TPA: family 16 glycoside hydrolase [Fibrobacteria bacterium]|nr:family 16 glycoside hydrolase [Fibrobacteria bacterium]